MVVLSLKPPVSPTSTAESLDFDGRLDDLEDGGVLYAKPYLDNVLYASHNAALTQAVADLGANGRVIQLPYGSYTFQDSVSRPSNVTFRGVGNGTIILAGASMASGKPLFDTIRSGTGDFSGSTTGGGLEDMQLDGQNQSGVLGFRSVNYVVGAPVESGRTNWLTKVKIRRCTVGIRLVNDQGIDAKDCKIQENTTGLYASDNAQLGHFDACDFRGNTTGTLLEASGSIISDATLDSPYGFKFTRCHWEVNTGKGLVVDGGTFNTFDTCKWEQNGDDSVTITQTGTKRPDGNCFINCLWNGNASAPTKLHVNIAVGTRTTFVGGWMNVSNTGGFTIAAAATHTMTVGTQLDCTVTDTGNNLTRLRDAATSAMLYKTTDNSAAADGGIQVSAGTGAGNLNAFALFQDRARFGFNGPGSFVQIDDAGTNKGFSIKLNGAERVRVVAAGDLSLKTVGAGLQVKEGANAKMGTATLGGGTGTVTVSTTAVATGDRIFITPVNTGGTAGFLSYTISTGASFTVTSTQATDTRTFNWMIVTPSP